MDKKQRAISWLKQQYREPDFSISELGGNVALFLDQMWGLHHLNRTSLNKVVWDNNTWIEITIDRPMSTIDNDDLTRLVVIAHQMMLRVDLRGCGPGYIKLMFHQRTSRDRENGINAWCPHIKEHVELITKYHPAFDTQEETHG